MKMIILDNGHGLDTAGKRSPKWPDGAPILYEWEYNRGLVKAIHERLCRLNIPNTVLVPEAEDIPLRQRTDRANDIAIRNGIAQTLLVSVHGNASETHKASGWEIWTSNGHTKSDEYAKFFQKAAIDNLPGNFPIRGCKESNFWILKHTACPAVLTENLFYDFRRDYDFLMSDEGFRRIVALHVQAIAEIWKATV